MPHKTSVSQVLTCVTQHLIDSKQIAWLSSELRGEGETNIHRKGIGTGRGEELGTSLQSVILLGQELASCGPQAKSDPPPDFVNQVLLEHSHSYSLTYCLWLFLYFNAELRKKTEAI